MAYDFKREFRDLYQPKARPSLVDVPAMTFAAIAGTGDPWSCSTRSPMP